MNIFKQIFASSENTKTIVDGAVSGVDKLFYTKEEKADNAKYMSEWFLRYLEASQPQNLARRFIALIIVGLWAFLVLLAVMVYKIDESYSAYILGILKDVVSSPFVWIIGFYFAKHLISSAIGQAKK